MTSGTDRRYRLEVLGARELWSPEGTRVSSVLAQPKRLCLLTYLALSPDPVSRSTVAALFWPESDETRARNALNQAIFYLRRSTTAGVVENFEGELVWVRPELLWCDAREVLGDDPTPEAVLAGERDLLEGWIADDSQPLQEWLDATRRKIRERTREHRERLAAEEGSEMPGATGVERTMPGADGIGPGGPTSPAPVEDADRAGESAVAPPTASRSPRLGHRRALLAAAALAAVLLAAGMGGLGVADANDAPGAAGPEAALPVPPETPPTLLVLRPIWSPTSEAPRGLERSIMAEVVSSLSGVSALTVQDASFLTERADIGLVLPAIGQDERPALYVQMVLTLTGTEIRAQTNLWGDGGYALGSSRVDLSFPDMVRLEWGAPDSIASTVVQTVTEELAARPVPR